MLMAYLSQELHLNPDLACQVLIATVWENTCLFKVAGNAGEDTRNDISRDDYPGGYTLYAVDLDPEAQYTLKKRMGNFQV